MDITVAVKQYLYHSTVLYYFIYFLSAGLDEYSTHQIRTVIINIIRTIYVSTSVAVVGMKARLQGR